VNVQLITTTDAAAIFTRSILLFRRLHALTYNLPLFLHLTTLPITSTHEPTKQPTHTHTHKHIDLMATIIVNPRPLVAPLIFLFHLSFLQSSEQNKPSLSVLVMDWTLTD